MRELAVPLKAADIASLRAGDLVSLSGVALTARDQAHKYMVETLLTPAIPPQEMDVYRQLQELLRGGVIYHCGPVVERTDTGWRFVAAGPTTSSREEEYEDKLIEHFGIRAIIGKGGMGPRTLAACQRFGAVYLHAVGGAGAVIADHVPAVLGVLKPEFGVPEAMWIVRLAGLKLVVTMDSHGRSLHEEVARSSRAKLRELIGDTLANSPEWC